MARDKVVVRGIYQSDKPGGPDLDAAFDVFLRQIERDVLVGTFNDYHESIFANKDAFKAFTSRATEAASCFDERENNAVANGRFGFRLELACDLFADPAYGLQRLVNTLASDLFERRVHAYQGKAGVTEIEFGDLKHLIEGAYRPKSHSIAEIRQAFELDQDQPLLAFSLKPRTCLSADDYFHITDHAFRGGCHIVELDTRDLLLDRGEQRADLLVRLTERALQLSEKRICRFSANISGPAGVIGPTLEALSEVHQRHVPGGPWVVKVDGNLDGLSTMQAIRADAFALYRQPIITCYPVLKYALQPALGRNAWVQMLAMSGADIIYPGQSPDFGRSNGRIDPQRVAAAQEHYAAMDLGGYPMLSVAGGISINSVHACLSVLGPNIAFFVGGGIALSRSGIWKGAENFAKAIDLARQDLFLRTKIHNLEDKFVDLSRIYFDEKIPNDYEFIRPSSLKNVLRAAKSTNLEN